jgi:hypothetical protein
VIRVLGKPGKITSIERTARSAFQNRSDEGAASMKRFIGGRWVSGSRDRWLAAPRAFGTTKTIVMKHG